MIKRVAVIGGKLQGAEACYLARKAGFFSILVDKNENPPAKGMCDTFLRADVREMSAELLAALRSVDFVLPALEDEEALEALKSLAAEYNIVFDFGAYAVTASKKKSDLLFHENGIPAPVYYPDCTGPYIAKPEHGSGSTGVKYLHTRAEAEEFLSVRAGESWIVQEFLPGRSYSIEVIGEPGRYRTYQVTEIHVDEEHDCRLVTCPCDELTAAQRADLSATAVKLAGLLGLRGIMDVEAILSGGVMKVLEIDARLPSQTPAAVLRSTGINFLEELHALFCGEWTAACGSVPLKRELPTAYEHVEIEYPSAGTSSPAALREVGEGHVSRCAPLTLYENHPADEIITDYRAGDYMMRATLINSAESREALERKRRDAKERLLGGETAR